MPAETLGRVKDTHTPLRSFRIPDALWEAARREADANGESLSDVIRQALEQYVKRSERKRRDIS